jgi:hypothetical protein
MADQIIDWSLTSGKRQYGLRNSGDVFEWRLGEPIEIWLRWAANSSYSPVVSQGGTEGYSVQSRTVGFHFKSEWSLQELILKHGERRNAGESLVLRFNINVVGAGSRSVTQVFIALDPLDETPQLLFDAPTYAPPLMGRGGTRSSLIVGEIQ